MVGLGSVLIEIDGGSGLGTDGCQGTWWVWGQQWVLEPLHLTPLPPRDSVDLRLEELKPFIPPAWMTEKMQKHMETLRRGGDVPPPEEPPEP